MHDAVRYAETYQCPVFFLTDLNLSEGRMTLSESVFKARRQAIERRVATESEVRGERYLRYRFTDSGISPRLIPGTRGAVVKMNSTEHDEFGFVTTDPPGRVMMMDKRMRKMLTYLQRDAKPPQTYGTPGERADPRGLGLHETGPDRRAAAARG